MKKPLPLVLASFFATSLAHAEDGTVAVDIRPQPLAAALESLAQKADLQLLYPAEAVAGKQAAGFSGTYTPKQALEKLLAGMGLTYHFTGDHTVAIREVESGVEPVSVSVEEPLPISLETMVVTATKTERPASEVPATTAMIDERQISQMYNRDLSDVLRRAAGVDIERGTTTSIASINLRGLGALKSATLVNGQYADFIDTGIGTSSAIQTIDWDDVERVEIVRGAGSALYGPNALGGVVNVITKEAPDEPNVTRPFFVFDSLPTYGGGVSTGGTIGDFSYLLNVKHLSSDGYKSAPRPAFLPGSSSARNHSLEKGEWERTMVGGRFGYRFSDRAKLGFSYNFLDDQKPIFDRPNARSDGQFGQYAMEYEHQITDRFGVTAIVGLRDHQAESVFDGYSFPFILDIRPNTTLFEDAQKLTGELRGRWDLTQGHTLLFGYNAAQDWTRRRNVSADTGVVTDRRKAEITNHGLYLQYELALWDRLFVTVGGRYDWFDYDLDADIGPNTHRNVRHSFDTFNPRGGVRFKFSDAFSIRATAGTGFRTPDPIHVLGGLNSPYLEQRPNPGLKPEKSDSFDLGFNLSLPFGLEAAVTGYYNELTDYILTSIHQENGKTIIQGQNLGEVRTYGAEVELTQAITDHLGLFANYTYNIAEAVSESPVGTIGLPEKGKQLPLTPKHKVAFGLVYDSPRLSGRLEGRYVDRRYVSGDVRNDPAFALASYVVADFRVTYRHPVGNKQTLDISAGVNNLFDRRYEPRFTDVFAEPRVGFVQVGFQF